MIKAESSFFQRKVETVIRLCVSCVHNYIPCLQYECQVQRVARRVKLQKL